MTLVFLIHLASTMAMFGIIWFVQVVHYPLFARIDPGGFARYENDHTRLTSYVVAPLMCLEAGTGILLFGFPPPGVPFSALAAGFLLIALIWLSTFLLQVPQHRVLSRGFDPRAHRRLVDTNWIRTVAWTARAVLVLWMLARIAAVG